MEHTMANSISPVLHGPIKAARKKMWGVEQGTRLLIRTSQEQVTGLTQNRFECAYLSPLLYACMRGSLVAANGFFVTTTVP